MRHPRTGLRLECRTDPEAFPMCRNPNRFIVLPLLALSLATASAQAQVYQGGYNLGPDYGAMLQQQLQQGANLTAQMQQAEQQLVQRVMQDPQCQAMYQQHLAGGGRLTFPQFAYQYAATAGFTRDGSARFRAGEASNQQRERAAWQDYRAAEQQRGQGQQAYMDGYARNQQESGRVMQGDSSWVDPASGAQRALSYLGPNDAVDPDTGQRFHRDDSGRYYAQGADGLWYPLQPAQ
jgi:hypothetical protein